MRYLKVEYGKRFQIWELDLEKGRACILKNKATGGR